MELAYAIILVVSLSFRAVGDHVVKEVQQVVKHSILTDTATGQRSVHLVNKTIITEHVIIKDPPPQQPQVNFQSDHPTVLASEHPETEVFYPDESIHGSRGIEEYEGSPRGSEVLTGQQGRVTGGETEMESNSNPSSGRRIPWAEEKGIPEKFHHRSNGFEPKTSETTHGELDANRRRSQSPVHDTSLNSRQPTEDEDINLTLPKTNTRLMYDKGGRRYSSSSKTNKVGKDPLPEQPAVRDQKKDIDFVIFDSRGNTNRKKVEAKSSQDERHIKHRVTEAPRQEQPARATNNPKRWVQVVTGNSGTVNEPVEKVQIPKEEHRMEYDRKIPTSMVTASTRDIRVRQGAIRQDRVPTKMSDDELSLSGRDPTLVEADRSRRKLIEAIEKAKRASDELADLIEDLKFSNP